MHATIMHFATCLPDWNSLDSVRRTHNDLEGTALVFFALLVFFDVLSHFSSDDKKRERLFDRIGLCCFAIAVLAEIVAYPYGQRNDTLSEKIIGSLDAKAREAATKAEKALSDSTTALTQSGRALDKSSAAIDAAGKAQEKAGTVEKQLVESQKEAEQFLEDFRAQARVAFQRTGWRSVDTLAFLNALKGKPTGHVLVLANIDGGEPHQFAWQIWHTLNRPGIGWSAEIKQLENKSPWGTGMGMVVRCRDLPEKNWMTKPDTACGALSRALLFGTEGFANVGGGAGSTFFSEPSPELPDSEFVIEVYPQPKPLTAPAAPNKQ